jgi:hypothetical protein
MLTIKSRIEELGRLWGGLESPDRWDSIAT